MSGGRSRAATAALFLAAGAGAVVCAVILGVLAFLFFTFLATL